MPSTTTTDHKALRAWVGLAEEAAERAAESLRFEEKQLAELLAEANPNDALVSIRKRWVASALKRSAQANAVRCERRIKLKWAEVETGQRESILEPKPARV